MPRFGARRPFRPPQQRRPNRPPGGPSEERRAPTMLQRRPENVEVEIPGRLTVKELAELLRVQSGEVIRSLLNNGMLATINQQIDYDTAALAAMDLGFKPHEAQAPSMESTALGAPIADDPANLVPRPPVVTIMGHVDHGKTSLLDASRHTSGATGGAGGITQHIGAYQIERTHNGKRSRITFLDTPGHEAFTAMRARGAQATDIAVLVVAADDGVQPQTIEAITKVDLPDANLDRVKSQLAEHEVVVEEYGGDTPAVAVSARTKTGIDDLLDVIELVAELHELKANPNREA